MSISKDTLKNKTVLIIEDDQYILRVYKKWLNKYDINVITANDGALGLDTLREKDVDLILLDLGMPGLNGIETLQQMRRNPKNKDIPVIVLSNTTMVNGKDGYDEIVQEGVSGILRKYEVSLIDLLEAIAQCFEAGRTTLVDVGKTEV